MTGPRGKRKPEASWTSDLPAQTRPEAARRSRRVAAPVPPREREAPAAWIARPSSPVFTRETMDLNLTRILRRGRKVFVPDISKPAPLQCKRGGNMRMMMVGYLLLLAGRNRYMMSRGRPLYVQKLL